MVKTTGTVSNNCNSRSNQQTNKNKQTTTCTCRTLFCTFPCRCFARLRVCLHGGGGPQIGALTRFGEVKNIPALHAVLQPHHPGITFSRLLNVHEARTKKNAGKPRVFLCFWLLVLFYTHLLL